MRAVLPKGKQYDYEVNALNIAPYAQLNYALINNTLPLLQRVMITHIMITVIFYQSVI